MENYGKMHAIDRIFANQLDFCDKLEHFRCERYFLGLSKGELGIGQMLTTVKLAARMNIVTRMKIVTKAK